MNISEIFWARSFRTNTKESMRKKKCQILVNFSNAQSGKVDRGDLIPRDRLLV